jgi:hypothetical protein
MKRIAGVVGFIGSGKSTIGNSLIKNHGFSHDSFADPLKQCVANVFGWDRRMLEGDTKKSREWRDQPDVWWEQRLDWPTHKFSKYFPRFTPRVALQLFGTELFRQNFYDDIWIASLQKRLMSNEADVVITDCRFPNEIKAIRQLGGKIIRVIKGPNPDWYETAEAANSETFSHAAEAYETMIQSGVHVSEWAWVGLPFDLVIDNNGTLADLEENIKCLMKTLF